MLNKLPAFVRRYEMLRPGERLICAVSGGADSVALLFAMYLLRQKLEITVEAAHFNHCLRGEESDRDAQFVRDLCDRLEIPLHMGAGQVVADKKGLEAAAREARYAFFDSLPGKIATAHTADDNAETVLMHMVRGTGLKGLGAIAPVNGRIIRPMLCVTRQDVLDFLQAYHLSYVEDSSNATDLFLRNRLRHHVMPLLQKENPRFVQNLSQMALRLREDADTLSSLASPTEDVERLRQMPPALRSRSLSALLQGYGVPEPEAEHVALAEKLVFSGNPSARASFPANVVVGRNYGRLEKRETDMLPESVALPCPGEVRFGQVRISCKPADQLRCTRDRFTVVPEGQIFVRSRQQGDSLRLRGGTKSLKKLFIDSKIPVHMRDKIPVLMDEKGVLGVYGIGADLDRIASGLPAVEIRFEIVE